MLRGPRSVAGALGLVVAFVVLAGCSRKKPRKEEPAPTLAQAVVDAAAAPPIVLDSPPDAATSRSYKTVLHTGDSTVGGGHGLARALKARFEADGAKYISDTVNAATLLSSEAGLHLTESVAKYKPDLVLINLGTNEVFVPAPQALAARIRAIVHRVGARDCVWIGPPTWNGDKGIVEVLKDNVAPCRFFDSSNMGIERIVDGIHPTDKGGEQWAERFWTFFKSDA